MWLTRNGAYHIRVASLDHRQQYQGLGARRNGFTNVRIDQTNHYGRSERDDGGSPPRRVDEYCGVEGEDQLRADVHCQGPERGGREWPPEAGVDLQDS